MGVPFVQGSIQFIRNNIFSILLIVLIMFLITSFMVMHHIMFPKIHPVLERVVVVENFATNPEQVATDVSDQLRQSRPTGYDNSVLPTKFCASHVRDLRTGDNSCRQLQTSDTCNLTNCCVWASHRKDGEGCVGGNHLGPTFDAFDYKPDFLFSGKKHTI